jgi:hypothetical protein
MDYLVYQDKPRTDFWLKLIFILPPLLMFVFAFIFPGTGSGESLQIFFGAIGITIAMSLFYIFVMPSKYCILNNKMRIEFMGPFKFNIPFDTISAVRDAGWSTVGINLPTNFSKSSLLEIVRQGRMSVTITPSDKQAFVSSFHKAYEDWKQGKDN